MPRFKISPLPAGVVPIPGEPLRMHVASRTHARIRYLVDLEEAGFNGACSCQHWQFRMLPKMKEDLRDGIRKVRHCWHLQRAWEYFGAVQARLVAWNYYHHNGKTHIEKEKQSAAVV